MTLPEVTVIRRADQRRVPWKNGAGWTTELVARPSAETFDWRLSIAEVDTDCDFSAFPGIDRSILVLTGPGFTLHVGDAPPVNLAFNGPPHAFPGDVAARCSVHGPTRDFNVMTRRDSLDHTVTRRSLNGALALPRPAGITWAIYVVSGTGVADPGDCLIIEPAREDRSDHTLDGRGELIVVRLAPASTAARGTTN